MPYTAGEDFPQPEEVNPTNPKPVPNPSLTFREQVTFATLITSFETGAEQRRSKWFEPRWRFNLRYEFLKESEMKEFKEHFLAQRGQLNDFKFIHPVTLEQFRCRYFEDNFEIELIREDIYNLEMVLIEVKP